MDDNEIGNDNESCWDNVDDDIEEDAEEDVEEQQEDDEEVSEDESAHQHHLKGSGDDVIEKKKTLLSTSSAMRVSTNGKPLLQSSRRERISGFAALNEQNIFDAVDYISEESIARAILAPCCREECLRIKLNPLSRFNLEGAYTKVLEARRQLMGNEWKDKMLILKAILQGKNQFGLTILEIIINNIRTCILIGGVHPRRDVSDDQQQRMRVEYQLGHNKSSPSICAAAFCNAYGITHYMRKRLMKEVKVGLFHRSSATNDDIGCNAAVDKNTMKEIKQMLKDSKIKLPGRLKATMEIPDTVAMLKVISLIVT